MITYNYNENENIIYVERIGEVDLHDILGYIENIDENFENLQSLYIVDNFTHSTSIFNDNQYPVMVEELSKRLNKYEEIKHSVIIDKPLDTALIILFEETSKKIKNYSLKIFSTIEAAKIWLQ